MTDVYTLAIDLAKRSIQVRTTAPGGAVLFNRTVSRAKLETPLREQRPCIVAMEACATSHFWGRFTQSLNHEVHLIPPIYVKPLVKRQKNDAASKDRHVGIPNKRGGTCQSNAVTKFWQR